MTPPPVARTLIGRESELAAVAAALDGPPGRSALLTGPIGVGKTRLAVEAADARAAAGDTVVRAIATAATADIALGALAGVSQLSLRLGDRRDTVIDRVVAELAPTRGAGLLLFIDDVDLLDPLSHEVARAVVERRVGRLLGTVRTPSPPLPGPWDSPTVAPITVGDLDERAVASLLASVLDGPVAGETIRLLVAAAGGNPLLLHEVLAAARQDGSLRRVDGIWTMTEVTGALRGLGDLVHERLRGLSPEGRDALEVVAVAEVLPRPLAVDLLGPTVLAELDDRALVVADTALGEPVVRPSHPFYGEVLRAGLGPIARRHHARRLADAAEGGTEAVVDVLRVVAWRSEAGGSVDAALLAQAAREARRRAQFDRAEALAARAVDASGGAPALLVLGEIQNALGRFAEADRTFSRVVDPLLGDDPAPPGGTDIELVALTALALGFNRAWGLGHGRAARDVLLAVAEVLEAASAGDERAAVAVVDAAGELRADAANCAAFFGDPSRAVAEASELLVDSRPPRLEARVEFAVAAGLIGSGRPAAAVEHAEAGLAALAGVPEGFGKASFTTNLLLTRIMGLAEAGRIDEAERAAEETYHRSVGAAFLSGQAVAAWARGRVHLLAGRPDRAERWLREARAIERDLQTRGRRRWSLVGLGLAHAAQGRWRDAAEALAVVERLDAEAPVDDRWVRSDEVRLRAALLGSRGELSACERLLLEGAAECHAEGAVGAAVALWHEVVVTAVSRRGCVEAATRLTETGDQIDGALNAARVADGEALLVRDRTTRLDVAQGLADLGVHAVAAQIARAVSVEAMRAGDRPAARRARTMAGLGAPPSDGRPAGADRLGNLSPRQREVAMLAAGGRSNQEIADRLGITVRTVENHLHRAYAELGVDGRRGLLDPDPAERPVP